MEDDSYRDGEISFEELNDLYQEAMVEREAALHANDELVRKNKQLTMDLIMIAATLGADGDMRQVMERINELVDREAAYKVMAGIA